MNEYVGRYIWPGTISRIIIQCNTITSECLADIQSVAYIQEEGKDMPAAAKGAEQDF